MATLACGRCRVAYYPHLSSPYCLMPYALYWLGLFLALGKFSCILSSPALQDDGHSGQFCSGRRHALAPTTFL